MDHKPSLLSRVFSRGVDTLIIFTTVIIIVQIFSLDTQSLIIQISEAIFWLWYFIFIPYIWIGLTIGKRLNQTQLIMVDGHDVKLRALIIRELFIVFAYVLSFGILWIVSLVMIYRRSDNRALHDLVAGTQVVKTDYL